MNNKTTLICILLSILITSGANAGYKQRKLDGFNWYGIDVPAEENQDSDKKHNEQKIPEYERNIRDLQERYKRAHRRALDNPTHENILAEMKIEKEMMDKSKNYGKRRVVVTMMNSEFSDMEAHSNVLHRRVQEQIDAKKDSENLQKLSKGWGLILQVEQNCPHCHTFAPIVLGFAKEYGFELLAASNNGQDFNGIDGVKDRGQMVIFNPNRETPVLYLVKADGKEVIPIARGVNATEQIITNIKMIDQQVRKLF